MAIKILYITITSGYDPEILIKSGPRFRNHAAFRLRHIWSCRCWAKKNIEKVVIMDRKILLDNGGRRSRIDRRRFSYAVHIPESRSSIDRRKGLDRRGDKRKYTKHIIEKEQQEQAV
jgi:hypothetical protein